MARIAVTLSLPDSAGAARMAYYFARALIGRGHEVVVVHGPPPDGAGRGARSILGELRECGAETRLVPMLRRPLPPFVYRKTVEAAAGCEVVIGVNQRDRAVAVGTARSLGVPAVLAVQNQHNFWGPRPLRRLKRHYYGRAVRAGADVCVCASKAVAEQLIEMGVEADRCLVLHNGVEMDTTAPTDHNTSLRLRAELGIGASTRVFVNVGRLDVQKAQDVLVAAWARAVGDGADAVLLLVGDVTPGSQLERSTGYKAELLEAVDHLGVADSVMFLGWRDDVRDLLAASDTYVHSARWEGWPLTVVEAMASSRPFIMTDCSGQPHGFEQAVQGYVVRTDDVDDLAGAIGHCLALPGERLHAMGDAARALALEHYDIDVVGRRFSEIVEDALACGVPRS